MPLTQAQIDASNLILDGDNTVEPEVLGLNDYVNAISNERDNFLALIRIHKGIGDADATRLLSSIKAAAKVHTDKLAALLT